MKVLASDIRKEITEKKYQEYFLMINKIYTPHTILIKNNAVTLTNIIQ